MSDSSLAITDEEIESLKACNSEDEWNEACDKIKKARNRQYPYDWWPKVIQSGLMNTIVSKFGGSTDIKIEVL